MRNVQFAAAGAVLVAMCLSAGCSSPTGTGTGGGTGGSATGGGGGASTGGGAGGGSACGDLDQACCASGSCNSPFTCQGGVCVQQRVGETGKPCSRNSDCLSGICLPVGGASPAADAGWTGNVCSTSCSTGSDCVGGWSCNALIGQSTNVCQCTSTTETCNGKDDDCNGILDDEPTATRWCLSTAGTGQACNGGSCVCGLTCGAQCVNPKTDVANCGGCGRQCPTGASCVNEACVCPAGLPTDCGGVCRNLQSDDKNCGQCGNACSALAPTAMCKAGTCACPGSQAACRGTCVDTSADVGNCGTCGHTCLLTQRCSASVCLCPAGQDVCGGVCTLLGTSAACGSCSTACAAGQLCATGGACVAKCTSSVRTHAEFAVGGISSGIATADFNGDGKADLVVGSAGSVSILLGNGSGGFQAYVAYSTGSVLGGPVAAGDLNGDGAVDLAVTNQGVRTLLGVGNGTFLAQVVQSAQGDWSAIAIADLNNDSKLDLIATARANSLVSVLLGNGNGTFQTKVDYATGGSPVSLVVKDLNADGKVDVVVGNWTQGASVSSLSVLLGTGTGTLQPKVDYPAAFGLASVVAADFNTDGKVDLAVIFPTSVSLLLGNGTGTFAGGGNFQYFTYADGHGGLSAAAGDLDGDGTVDLAIGTVPRANGVLPVLSVLRGNGNGTFQPRVDFPTPISGNGVLIADFDGYGRADLAITAGNLVSVLTDYANSTFAPKVDVAPGGAGWSSVIDTGDLNGDGRADVVRVDGSKSGFGVILSQANGTFLPEVKYPGNGTQLIAMGDLDGDRKLDVVTTTYVGQTWTVLSSLGKGDGTFDRWAVTSRMGYQLTSLTLGDVNGDGVLDAVLSDGNIWVMLGQGDGYFQLPTAGVQSGAGAVVALGDLNGDGKLDLVVGKQPASGSAVVSVSLGVGNGTFQPPVDYPAANPANISIADFNRDGVPDLAVGSAQAVNLLLGSGAGVFQAKVSLPVGGLATAGDLNGDGVPDLAVTDTQRGGMNVLMAKGNGTFLPSAYYDLGSAPWAVARVGDFNGDGRRDLAVQASALSVLFGECRP